MKQLIKKILCKVGLHSSRTLDVYVFTGEEEHCSWCGAEGYLLRSKRVLKECHTCSVEARQCNLSSQNLQEFPCKSWVG